MEKNSTWQHRRRTDVQMSSLRLCWLAGRQFGLRGPAEPSGGSVVVEEPPEGFRAFDWGDLGVSRGIRSDSRSMDGVWRNYFTWSFGLFLCLEEVVCFLYFSQYLIQIFMDLLYVSEKVSNSCCWAFFWNTRGYKMGTTWMVITIMLIVIMAIVIIRTKYWFSR